MMDREKLESILSLSGNNNCCDCQSFENEWASVSFGILLCLDCAGRHRGLGVQVSYVKSLHLDTWTSQEIEYLIQGGNLKLMEYFQTHNINHLPFESKYKSQVATQYCEMLKSQVLENLTIQAITTLEDPVPMDHFSVECTFWEGPIGMTLVKDESCRAVVAKLVANGPAEKKGVCIGDIVGSIRGQSFLTYEELMDLILLLPRPIQIQFLRLQVDDSDHLEPISEHRHKSLSISGCDAPLLNETIGGFDSNSDTPLSVSRSYSPPRYSPPIPSSPFPSISLPSPSPPLPPPVVPKLSDFRVVFETVPFGMTVSRDGTTHRAAIVTRVVSSGQASRVGIQVGDLIVGIENNWIEGYDDFLATIKKVNYPVSLVIRRAQRS